MPPSIPLGMIGLGIEGDAPPVDIQPKLANGVHLRWAARRQLGFPWWGYYLFRRTSGETKPLCLSPQLRDRKVGDLPGTSLALEFGTFTSDRPVRLTDDFPPSGVLEVDLAGRAQLRFAVPAGDAASRVELKVGFRDVRDQLRQCVDLRSIVSAPATNPVRLGPFLIATGPGARGRPVPARAMLRHVRGQIVGGLDGGRESVIYLDDPADEVSVLIAHIGGRVQAAAYDARGALVAETRLPADQAHGDSSELSLISGAAPISRVAVGTTGGETALLQICRASRNPTKQVLKFVASYRGVPMAEQVLTGGPGEVVPALLTADAIDQVDFQAVKENQLPNAALIELCYVAVNANSRQGWQPVPKCSQPITLPLYHPDYPATGDVPVDETAAEALALDRVLYGNPADYGGTPFAELHSSLIRLVEGGPAGPPMADPVRASDVAASGGAGSAPTPVLSDSHPLDLVLMAAINPAAAQMLGLFWVDRTAVPGQSYDYLVIGDWNGGAGKEPMKVLVEWLGGAPSYLGYIVWNKQAAPAPPLPPPDGPVAYELPPGAVITQGASDGPAPHAAGLVGLRWALPFVNNVLLPRSAVAYHLWRESLGDGDNPAGSTGLGTWLTKAGPVLLGEPILGPFSTPQAPPDWPDFAMYRIDRVNHEGWYAYRVSGMDLFGRVSPPATPIPWRQWAPPPTPLPWYYELPSSDAVVHPSAVQVLDKTPPPPPVGVEAATLDPLDPYVIADAPYLAWRAGLLAAVRDTLVGLRVTWRWTVSQASQAPDTNEFRVYFNPGGGAPSPDPRAAGSWAERVHVVDFAAATIVDGAGNRTYVIFLPVTGGTVFTSGLPLVPTLADPLTFAYVGVSAADGAPHTADDPRWAASAWGGRPGNEGFLGVPAKIYRVLRLPPDPPAVAAPDADRVYATPADYHAKSFYTYRWRPADHLRTHVLRAMDESLFAVDRVKRPRPALTAATSGIFPDQTVEPRWDSAKRAQVATALNGLNDFPATSAGEVAARAAYRALSNDGLRVLAGLPGNEAAFTQITVRPLDPADAATANALGPDNSADFVIDPGLRIFIDTLDGRSTNRYFYRAAYVDGAGNRSALSLSGPPVWLPNVVPPRPPVLTAVAGAEKRIDLVWASNREADLVAYHVYRADNAVAARDIRSMARIGTIAVSAGDPTARPASVTWSDDPVPGLVNFYYAVRAIDDAGNESGPSRVGIGRAFDESLPVPPPLAATWSAAAPPAAARLVWTSDDDTRVERRVLESLQWDPVGGWRPPGAHDETMPLDATLSWRLRLRVRKNTGAQAIGAAVPLNHL
jgi:hypothetical protein